MNDSIPCARTKVSNAEPVLICWNLWVQQVTSEAFHPEVIEVETIIN
jgi:hypothetical protein